MKNTKLQELLCVLCSWCTLCSCVAYVSSCSSAAAAQAIRHLHRPERRTDSPDIQGIWRVVNTAAWDLEDHAATLGVTGRAWCRRGRRDPLSARGTLQKTGRTPGSARRSTRSTKCYLPGVPRITYQPYPFRIVQQRDKVSILLSALGVTRFLYMNR